MRKGLLFLILLLSVCFFTVACEGSGGQDESDGDVTDGDATDGDAVDGDVEIEVDGDEPECDCEEETECCDGCDFINEGGECEDGNLCTADDSCAAGVCVGGTEAECEAVDQCHEAACNPDTGECVDSELDDDTECDDENPCTLSDSCQSGVCEGADPKTCPSTDVCNLEGTCDTETGDCVNPSVINGTSCEAEAGVPGSGMCFDGLCSSFGDCDHRSYGQPTNYPCNFDAECESGMCIWWEDAWPIAYCSASCGDGQPECPENMLCEEEEGVGQICKLQSKYSSLPQDASLDIYDACNSDADCLGGLCLSSRGMRFCSKDCAEGSAICGSCGKCRSGGLDNGFPFDNYCRPTGTNQMGEACGYGFDCESLYCLHGYCSNNCVAIDENLDTCPEGMKCRFADEDSAGDPMAVCVYEDELGMEFGESCLGDYACVSETCREVAGDAICVADCTTEACETGVCVDYEPVRIDTQLNLFKDGVEDALVYNDDGGEGMLSKITYTITEAGKYYVQLSGRFASVNGMYNLLVTDGSAEPADLAEAEMNNDLLSAQPISYPVLIAGTLGEEDLDYFTFSVTERVEIELTIETVTAWNKICLPDDIAGVLAYGEACEESFQCADDMLCYNNFCTETCTEEADCPDGICFEFGAEELYCVPASMVGGSADGEACDVVYECLADRDCFNNICSIPCTEDEDCTSEVCWDYGGDNLFCVLDADIGGVEDGGACDYDYQCLEDRNCFQDECRIVCSEDDDCTDGICWEYGVEQLFCVDNSEVGILEDGVDCSYEYECVGYCMQDTAIGVYCSTYCDDDEDCADEMQCFEGSCFKALDPRNSYLVCRIDLDCTTGLCLNGVCSNTCEDDANCAGGTVPDPAEFEICWPCVTNADCNDGGTDGPNLCVDSPLGETFCATDCTYDYMLCPDGTACYQVGWFNSVCAPMTMSCERTTACTDAGFCQIPSADVGEICSEDANCAVGDCINNICQAESCSVDDDCGCDYFSCSDAACELAPGDDTVEVEPNDTEANAQVLDTFPVQVISSLMAGDAGNDRDLYKVSMKEGDAISAYTWGMCGQSTDTYIRLLDAAGILIEGFENNDINPGGGNLFSAFFDYVAAADGDVYIEVTQAPTAPISGFYVLRVDSFPLAINNTCDGALEIGAKEKSLEMQGAVNSYLSNGCTSRTSNGPDLTYSVTVPDGNVLSLSIDPGFDAHLYLVDDCSDTGTSCIAGMDQVGVGEVERLEVLNDSGQEETYTLIVDSVRYLMNDGISIGENDFSLDVSINPLAAPGNDTAPGLYVTESGLVSGSLTGAADDYDPGAEGCAGMALPGADVVYALYLEAGDFISVAATAFGFGLHMYLVTNPGDLSTCVAHSQTRLNYAVPDVKAPYNYYLIVDTATADTGGPFDLDFLLGQVGECAGPCDSATSESSCVTDPAKGVGMCACNSNTGLYDVVDCKTYCMETEGIEATTGVCLDPEDLQRSGGAVCACEADCSNEQNTCAALAYDFCTCNYTDPCSWKDDAYCDSYCMVNFPYTSFDDTGDCVK